MGHLHYRSDIDGLRAVAVIPVVLFHADVALFRGGFVGVDVFFVISGYLITAIIDKEISERHFSFAGFYERRIRRILPALVVLALCCTLAAAIIQIPTDFASFGKSLIALAFFASNMLFRQDVGAAGYFHQIVEPPLLVHTWSLAVEEQFYIILPPVRRGLCSGNDCRDQEDGVSLYADDNHIAKSKVGLFHDVLRDALARDAAP